MANVFSFRSLRWGPPRRLPTPHFLRERRWRTGLWLLGVLFAAALIAALKFPLNQKHESPAPPQAEKRLLRVTVVDGDSLRTGAGDIRLMGIDAMELRQTCRNAEGREWACGRAARNRLSALLPGGEVSCASRGRDRYGRTLAICAAGGVADLGEAMVREGYAINAFEGSYHAAEAQARAARRGIWEGSFERPQEWRRQHPRTAERR